jgi:hypothetical protein
MRIIKAEERGKRNRIKHDESSQEPVEEVVYPLAVLKEIDGNLLN